ncbi:MAG TPA: hypothetical protein DCQ28_11330 [Bacteroidetes bacterium]|nr:hypothetical protein [Bacteroidota bacterium]
MAIFFRFIAFLCIYEEFLKGIWKNLKKEANTVITLAWLTIHAYFGKNHCLNIMKEKICL